MIRAVFLALLLVLAAVVKSQAQHLRNCAPRDAILERLEKAFGERLQSFGLTARGETLEVFASDETGTWTVVLTAPNGMSCIPVAGTGYEAIQPPEGGDDA